MSQLEILGWVGNALFFSRWLIQWHASEKAKQSVAPLSFWWISLIATITLGTYTLIKAEPILLVGYCVNCAIYVRNLALAKRSKTANPWKVWQLTLVAAFVAVALVAVNYFTTDKQSLSSPAWNVLGIAGLTVWNSRWALQWWHSEKRSLSHFPPAFWWVSLLGNTMLLVYTIHLGNLVWIASYALGPVIQTRNLILNRRAARQAAEASTSESESSSKTANATARSAGEAVSSQS